MYMSTLLRSAAFASVVSAQNIYQTTATIPADTLTLPGGFGETQTRTVGGATITGSAAVISGMTVIANDQQVAFLSGGAVQIGNAQGTNDFNGVTVVDGSIPGGSAPAATTSNSGAGDGGETINGGLTGNNGGYTSTGGGAQTSTPVTTTNSAGSVVTSTAAVTSSTTKPNAGDRAFGSVQMLGWAGAAVGAAAVVNL